MSKAIATVVLFFAISAHAADGPVVSGPKYDAATCERIWWSMVTIEEQLEQLGGSCGGRTSRANCHYLKEQLRLLRDQLVGLYYGSYCYLWTARDVR